MKEQSREIKLGDRLHFPSDIQYIPYSGKILAIAVETANWLVLPDNRTKDFLQSLREGETIGEVLGRIGNGDDKKAFLKLLSAIMARQFAGLDEIPSPSFVQGYKMLNIYLTNACNLSCTHCFMKAGKKLKNELSVNDWIRVLDEFTQAGGQFVTFTGGEPLMNPDFQTIIESAHKKGLQSTILTNGILWTDELIDQLSPLLAEVQISIDGVDDESNAKVRKAGIFEQLVNQVVRFSNNGVRVSVATTFTNDNIDSADKYVELVKRINEATDKKVFFKLTKKILPGRAKTYTEDENKAYEARIRQIEELIDANAKYQSFMEGHTPNLVSRNCGFGGLSIAADGNVYFCNRVLEVTSHGNVKDHPLLFFLQKGEQAHFETSVEYVDPCRTCVLRYICGGGCRIDEYDFRGKEWSIGQLLKQLKCQGPNEHLLKMMIESYEYQYSF
ncbi:radical SAM protein [Prevotella communis]|uniref:radical SAM/SPASM domain-containing protein n=1 Tax=Prevotella communis TaxID=2913614 RepID=UPI001EDABF6B|nr:radical SAM protein [Prevotella communis]UKK67544.1 radical SAM protein [Prevotella communis]UKK70309.1 radical SAM protein [Prevotella communis]